MKTAIIQVTAIFVLLVSAAALGKALANHLDSAVSTQTRILAEALR